VLLVITAAVMVVAAESGALGQYLHAWKVWLSGRTTGGLVLAGHSLLYWGRLGKLLEFVAGLVVVFDFVDPERVRQRGRDAQLSRQAGRSALTRLRSLRRAYAMEKSLVNSAVGIVKVDEPSKVWLLTGWPILRLPQFAVAGFTTEEVELFHREAISAEQRRRIGDTAAPSVQELARSHVAARLDEPQRSAYMAAAAATSRTAQRAALVLVAVSFSVIFLVLGLGQMFAPDGEPSVRIALANAACIIAVAAIVTALVLAHGGEMLVMRTRMVTSAVAYAAFAITAAGLDKANPDHAFRKLALLLFIVGFQLDLLAS
jgi:hypothetical protein